jgi:hypothetical protein
MNHKKSLFPIIALLALLVAGCGTFYTGIVTLTGVVDSGMKEWAHLSNAGKTTPAIDASVKKAHATYQQACGVAKVALQQYKAGGSQANYVNALETAKVAAAGLFDVIVPLLTVDKADSLKTRLAKASTL